MCNELPDPGRQLLGTIAVTFDGKGVLRAAWETDHLGLV
jgi:hypothetical protein